MWRTIWEKWKAFGHFMGDVLARVVLTIFYFTILVPFGVGVSLFSDRLGIKSKPSAHWQERTSDVVSMDAMRRQA